MPTPLPQISSRAWEHPADRAALNTLRAIPGFDEVVRRVAGFITERGVRQLFLANAVKVGPQQRPKLVQPGDEIEHERRHLERTQAGRLLDIRDRHFAELLMAAPAPGQHAGLGFGELVEGSRRHPA